MLQEQTDAPAPPGSPSVAAVEAAAVRRIPLEILVLTSVVGLGLGLIFGLETALFFAAGGVVSTLSFLWMKRTVAGLLARKKAAAVRSGLLFYALRFVLILGVFLLIILVYPDRILAFAAGFSMAVPAFAVEAVRAYALVKTWKA